MARPLGKFVCDIMSTNAVAVSKETTLDVALRIMISNHVSRLPVVDAEGKVKGIVTDRDLRLAADSPFLDAPAQEKMKHLQSHKISDIMKTAVVTVEDTAPVIEAAKLIRVSRIGGLPVTDTAGKLVGVCTQSDLIDHLIRMLEPIPSQADE